VGGTWTNPNTSIHGHPFRPQLPASQDRSLVEGGPPGLGPSQYLQLYRQGPHSRVSGSDGQQNYSFGVLIFGQDSKKRNNRQVEA